MSRWSGDVANFLVIANLLRGSWRLANKSARKLRGNWSQLNLSFTRCAYMNFVLQGFLKLSSDRQTDRQTRLKLYTTPRFVCGQRQSAVFVAWPNSALNSPWHRSVWTLIVVLIMSTGNIALASKKRHPVDSHTSRCLHSNIVGCMYAYCSRANVDKNASHWTHSQSIQPVTSLGK